jgi:hypothetical protein
MLTKERQGEIALAYLKNKLRREGVKISPNMQRQIANEAKEVNIPLKEAQEFAEILVREIVEEAFARQ